MTMEPEVVNEFLARKAAEKQDRLMKFAANVIIYSGLTIAVVSLLELLVRSG